jgi:preprotein translocase subunit SecE
MADKLKMFVALLVLIAALGAFYWFEEQSLLYRVLGLLVALSVAAWIALLTETGRSVKSFMRGSLIEVRKVVWPSRKETTQTTMLVVAMVVLVGIFLWLLDMFLLWAVELLTHSGV